MSNHSLASSSPPPPLRLPPTLGVSRLSPLHARNHCVFGQFRLIFFYQNNQPLRREFNMSIIYISEIDLFRRKLSVDRARENTVFN